MKENDCILIKKTEYVSLTANLENEKKKVQVQVAGEYKILVHQLQTEVDSLQKELCNLKRAPKELDPLRLEVTFYENPTGYSSTKYKSCQFDDSNFDLSRPLTQQVMRILKAAYLRAESKSKAQYDVAAKTAKFDEAHYIAKLSFWERKKYLKKFIK